MGYSGNTHLTNNFYGIKLARLNVLSNYKAYSQVTTNLSFVQNINSNARLASSFKYDIYFQFLIIMTNQSNYLYTMFLLCGAMLRFLLNYLCRSVKARTNSRLSVLKASIIPVQPEIFRPPSTCGEHCHYGCSSVESARHSEGGMIFFVTVLITY